MDQEDGVDRTDEGGEDLGTRLLIAAEELIASRGVAAVSLREVARRAGVSHAAPGHVFGDKRGLFTAVATRCFARFGEHVERRSAGADTGVERLALAGVGYVEYATANWPLFEFMGRLDLVDGSDVDYADAANRSHRLLSDTVAAAQREGWCRGIPAADLVQLCWALVHGLSALQPLPVDGTPDVNGVSIDEIERLIRLQLAALADVGPANTSS